MLAACGINYLGEFQLKNLRISISIWKTITIMSARLQQLWADLIRLRSWYTGMETTPSTSATICNPPPIFAHFKMN